jgi:hypothetical protein
MSLGISNEKHSLSIRWSTDAHKRIDTFVELLSIDLVHEDEGENDEYEMSFLVTTLRLERVCLPNESIDIFLSSEMMITFEMIVQMLPSASLCVYARMLTSSDGLECANERTHIEHVNNTQGRTRERQVLRVQQYDDESCLWARVD